MPPGRFVKASFRHLNNGDSCTLVAHRKGLQRQKRKILTNPG
jgi:hypothetical protein